MKCPLTAHCPDGLQLLRCHPLADVSLGLDSVGCFLGRTRSGFTGRQAASEDQMPFGVNRVFRVVKVSRGERDAGKEENKMSL